MTITRRDDDVVSCGDGEEPVMMPVLGSIERPVTGVPLTGVVVIEYVEGVAIGVGGADGIGVARGCVPTDVTGEEVITGGELIPRAVRVKVWVACTP